MPENRSDLLLDPDWGKGGIATSQQVFMGQAKKLNPDARKLSGRYPAGVLEDPEPIAQRFAHSPDMRQASVGQPDLHPAARPGQRLAATREAIAALRGRSFGRGVLISGLVLVAVMPSLILGGLWLGQGGGTEPEPTDSPPEMRSETPAAILTPSERIEVTPGAKVIFPLALDGTDGVPSRSVIAIKGLPAGSNFSEGRPFGESEWTLRPDQIGDLQLLVPAGASGEFKLEIALITPGDQVITEAETLLAIAPSPVPVEPPAPVSGGVLPPSAGDPAAIATLRDGGEAASAAAAPDAASGEGAAPESMQEMTQAPTAQTGETATETAEQVSEEATAAASGAQPSTVGQPATDTSGLGTVEPSVFVNMREAPSSSSAVLGVIAKGTTLPVLGRKRGWVQVTDPESGKQGWIYSGLLVGEAKPYARKKRAAPAEAKSETNSESIWDRVGRWLTPDEPANEARVP
jgi:hypothetical protein